MLFWQRNIGSFRGQIVAHCKIEEMKIVYDSNQKRILQLLGIKQAIILENFLKGKIACQKNKIFSIAIQGLIIIKISSQESNF